jgi:hypothetical protein
MHVCAFLLLLFMSTHDTALLNATYIPAPGSDPEYAQGAIERNELPHREIERFVWLVQVPAPGDPEEWQRRLNASVDGPHGTFKVRRATPDEERRVASGEITLQK